MNIPYKISDFSTIQLNNDLKLQNEIRKRNRSNSMESKTIEKRYKTNTNNQIQYLSDSKDIEVSNKKICWFDISYYCYPSINKERCKRYPQCPFIHYDCGPYNEGYGWKELSKIELVKRLKYQNCFPDIIEAVTNWR